MYVAPSIGRMLLSRAIGSVFFIATAVIICIIKEEFNAKRYEKMGARVLPNGYIQGKCKYCNQREQCFNSRGSKEVN